MRGLAQLETWLGCHDCDLAVLDLGLPDGAGLSVIEGLRNGGRRGVVVMTARGQVQDRINGYTMGADNYLIKPVDMHELVAVLMVLYQRLPPRHNLWWLDVLAWELLAPGGQSIRLTRSEISVMKILAEAPGQPAERSEIARGLGLRPSDYDPRRLEILIRRLRRKIFDSIGAEAPIETVHGVGYVFAASIGFRNGEGNICN